MYGVMLGRVTSSCILAIFTLLRVVYICFCVVESVVLPVVPSSPVHYACMDIKCTVERLGSRTRCYAVLAMPSYGGNRGVVLPMIHVEHACRCLLDLGVVTQ